MAELSAADRVATWSQAMQTLVGSVGINKAELREAIDAIDTWVDANAAGLNAAIPLRARNGLSAAQKAALLKAVVARRVAVGA